MTILFLVLIILCAAVLGFIILIQSPKGGGLAGNIAGINNQFMGVKQTNDVLERGTWIFAGLIALLCLFSSFFMGSGADNDSILNKINTNQGTTAPAQKVPTQPGPAQPNQPAPGGQQPR